MQAVHLVYSTSPGKCAKVLLTSIIGLAGPVVMDWRDASYDESVIGRHLTTIL
jgi:hypothetical protein